MPSPTWCTSKEAPLFQALAAAQHAAWQASDDRRDAIFAQALRQLLGAEQAEPVLAAAISIFQRQRTPPTGFEVPPASAYFQICPRCQRLTGTKHKAPIRGRIKLAVLRDQDWLQQQLERQRTLHSIARQLGCGVELVQYWTERHGLQTTQTARREEIADRVPMLHAQGRGPGGIARELGAQVWTVRKALSRLGLANRKHGQVYHAQEWWVERLVRREWTVRECASEAGIRPHNATYYVTKFGLSHVTAARASRTGKSKWRPKYPELADMGQLRALLDHHGTYAAVAQALGCPASLVSKYARRLLGESPRHHQVVPHSARSWWTERLDSGLTTWQLAAEAGIQEATARERLRTFGSELLAQAWRNNTHAETARRRMS